ncbi:MAG: SoxR reducing system RseC family protein [Clostridia bacterium]|nr:SoxR reducing system RseC family protein [Clostridia bacterium]
MIEQGVVVKTENKFATVKVDKKDECSKCGMCLFPKNASSIEFTATNDKGAMVGDTVIIETEKDTKFLGAILVFLIPLILIGLAVLINALFIKSEIWVAALAVGFVVLWFFVLALIDKKLKKAFAFAPKIVEIIENKEKI